MTGPREAPPASQIEAILLVSPRPVPPDDLSAATGLTGAEIEKSISNLVSRYSGESGVLLRRVAGGYQLATNPSCAPAVERFREESRPAPLSSAAHEVLSCALYMGPLTRGGVSAVRGVNSDAVVRNLVDRGLLSEVGADHDSPGTPALLDVTEEFYAAVGAGSRQDFPPLDSLVAEEELARVRERLGASGEVPGEAPREAPGEARVSTETPGQEDAPDGGT